MSAMIARPFEPRLSRTWYWAARKSSACRLGMKTRPDRARLNASRPGTSSAAMREGPRTSCINRFLSSAVTKPDPNITSARVLPVICATSHLSRTILSPLRPVSSTRCAFPWSPNVSGLNKRWMFEGLTAFQSGVSAS